jgi:hypothetical protein
VSVIEPVFEPYLDIKPVIRELRTQYGDKPILKLMDNNVLASPRLPDIVADLLTLGYGRGEVTDSEPKRQRVIDFNQGLDASSMNEATMGLLSQLNVRPMRLAFDRLEERISFEGALELALRHGVDEFSVYMLYNFQDSPLSAQRRDHERGCARNHLSDFEPRTPDDRELLRRRLSVRLTHQPQQCEPCSHQEGFLLTSGGPRTADPLAPEQRDPITKAASHRAFWRRRARRRASPIAPTTTTTTAFCGRAASFGRSTRWRKTLRMAL